MKFAYPVTLEPEVIGGWYSVLFTLIGPILVCILDGGKNQRPWIFFSQKLCGFRWNDPPWSLILDDFLVYLMKNYSVNYP